MDLDGIRPFETDSVRRHFGVTGKIRAFRTTARRRHDDGMTTVPMGISSTSPKLIPIPHRTFCTQRSLICVKLEAIQPIFFKIPKFPMILTQEAIYQSLKERGVFPKGYKCP